MSSPAQPAEQDSELRSVDTANLPALFKRLGISLVVSTYQAGKAILVRKDGGALNTHFRSFAKPMGVTADPNRLTIGGSDTVWDYHNVPAVAHLAGTLGKPVWTLLDYVPDWRWGLNGDTRAWYTAIRLFRESEPADWAGVINRVIEALKKWRHDRPAN